MNTYKYKLDIVKNRLKENIDNTTAHRGRGCGLVGGIERQCVSQRTG